LLVSVNATTDAPGPIVLSRPSEVKRNRLR
jgi:hypothetical protein